VLGDSAHNLMPWELAPYLCIHFVMKYRRAQFEMTRMDNETPDYCVFIPTSGQVCLFVEEDMLGCPTATQSPMSDHIVFHRSLALSSPCNVGKRKV
jgi:hypothetical protein